MSAVPEQAWEGVPRMKAERDALRAENDELRARLDSLTAKVNSLLDSMVVIGNRLRAIEDRLGSGEYQP